MSLSDHHISGFEELVSNLQKIAIEHRASYTSADRDREVVVHFTQNQKILDALKPDIFIIANIFRPLPFLHEHNYSLDLGVEDSSYANIVQFISPEILQLSDLIDRKILEFCFERDIKPFDFVYRFYFNVDCPNRSLRRICRTMLMIATNTAGQLSHCVVCLNNITDQVVRVKYPGFEIKFSASLAHYEKELLDTISAELPEPYTLSDREREVILNLHNGLSSKMIAERLSISKHTVDTHRRNLLKKLKVSNTAGLLRTASDLGIV
jgi:DNA-binding CsgD family transcriptional regulator